MVHILGVVLGDNLPARFALTKIYGIGPKVAHRLCARLQIHDACKMRDLSPTQTTNLTAFLSSPHTANPIPKYPLAPPNFQPPPANTPLQEIQAKSAHLIKGQGESGLGSLPSKSADPLRHLKIETDLKRLVRENIAHQRMIGSYVGRRHAMGLPVRGQNTQTNARTARKLNRIDRYA